jgi:hypothetical protein
MKYEAEFQKAWARTGYQYNEDALENVRLGWELAMGVRWEQAKQRGWVREEDVEQQLAAARLGLQNLLKQIDEILDEFGFAE